MRLLRIIFPAILIVAMIIVPIASAENVTPVTTPFITIDPIGNHTIGDVFFINGTTNLPVSEKMTTYIYVNVIRRGTKSSPWVDPPGEYAIIPVNLTFSATPGTNRWSANLMDIAKTLVCQEYVVSVFSHDTHTEALFTLLPANYSTTSTVQQTTVHSPSPIQPTTSAITKISVTTVSPLPEKTTGFDTLIAVFGLCAVTWLLIARRH